MWSKAPQAGALSVRNVVNPGPGGYDAKEILEAFKGQTQTLVVEQFRGTPSCLPPCTRTCLPPSPEAVSPAPETAMTVLLPLPTQCRERGWPWCRGVPLPISLARGSAVAGVALGVQGSKEIAKAPHIPMMVDATIGRARERDW